MANFPGNIPSHYMIPRFQGFTYATRGFSSSHPTESGTFGIRKPAKLILSPIVTQEVAGKDVFDARQVKLDIDLLQNDLPTWHDLKQLSRGPFQLFTKLLQADGVTPLWLNFTEDTAADLTSPNGSTLLGMEAEITCTDKDRGAKCTIGGKFYQPEWTWMMSNSGSMSGGGASGSTLGLTPMGGEDLTKRKFPGIQSITINGSSFGIGDFNTPKLTVKLKKWDETTRLQPICSTAESMLEVNMLQSSITEVQAAITAETQQNVITINMIDGVQFVYTNCMSLMHEPNYGDDKNFIKLIGKGASTYNNVDFGIGSATVAAFTMGGY